MNFRNIFWIIADDLRPQLSVYGSPEIKSPNIDALAADSTLFERAYCQVPTCGASRASMLTGLYASPTRFINFNTRADQDAANVPDVAKTFRMAGYKAISNGKIYHHSGDNKESWDEVCGHDAGSIDGLPCNYTARPGSMCCIWPQRGQTRKGLAKTTANSDGSLENERESGKQLRSYVKTLQGSARFQANGQGQCFGCGWPAWSGTDVHDDGLVERGYPDGKMVVKIFNDLRVAKAEAKPFFITCGFVRPHLPFVAPLRDWEAYEKADVQVPPWGNNRIAEGAPPRALHYRELGVYDVGTNPVTDNSGGHLMPEYGMGNPLSEEISRSLVHGYYATVTYVDRLVGHVIGELKSLEMYDETIIVFNSDHGYQLGEHGTWCKHSLFETSLRIPLFIKAPGIAPSRVPALVENVDIYPTLLDLVGIAAPPHLHGKSLVPVMRDPSAPHKGPVFARYRDGDSVRFPDLAYSEYCLRSCWSPETCSQYCATPHPTDRMLYDHTIDPNEDLNRWNTGWNRSQYAGQIREMRAALDRHRRERDRA